MILLGERERERVGEGGAKRAGEISRARELPVVKMPHRTAYFFPRQFPDRGFDASSITPFEAHENQIRGNFNGDESDWKARKISREATRGGKSNGFTGDRIHGKQLAAFVNWLADRKGERRSGHVKVGLDDGEGDHELLLQPEPPESVVAVESQGFELEQTGSFQRLSSGTGGKEQQASSSQGLSGEGGLRGRRFELQTSSVQGLPSGSSSSYCGTAKERRFERQKSPFQGLSGGGGGYCGPAKERRLGRQASSLQGLLSSGSSYGGSLFSGTTAEGDSSSGVKDSRTTREEEEELRVVAEEGRRESLAERTMESYYLQLTLAKRLSEQFSLASEPLFLEEYRVEGLGGCRSADVETVSYRLWVRTLSLYFCYSYFFFFFCSK